VPGEHGLKVRAANHEILLEKIAAISWNFGGPRQPPVNEVYD